TVQQSTDPVNVRTVYTYESDGRVASVLRGAGVSGMPRYDYSYDPNFPDKVVSVTPVNPATGTPDRSWQATQYDYYQAGSPSPGSLFHTYRVKSDGSTELVSTNTYDAKGRILSQTNAVGAVTDY